MSTVWKNNKKAQFHRNRQLLKHTNGNCNHNFNRTMIFLDSQQNHAQTASKQSPQQLQLSRPE